MIQVFRVLNNIDSVSYKQLLQLATSNKSRGDNLKSFNPFPKNKF